MGTLGPNAKAIILYSQIKKLQKELLENLKKQGVFIKFERDLLALLKKEKIDRETSEALKMFMGKERPMSMTEQVELAVDRAIEKYKEKETAKQPTKKGVISPNIPPETKWENIKIQIINENNVLILVGSRRYEMDYKKMGFEDGRTNCPNKQWMFLWLLAINNGTLSWEDYQRNSRLSNLSLKDINKFKKTKQLLVETLKNCFRINDDPFYPYKKEKAYRIRINITSSRTDEFSP